MSNPPLIKAIGLSHSYGPQAGLALDAVNLSIPKGACLGLLGPNGAGKSTLIGLLTGVIARLEGDILINDAPIDKQGGALKKISALAPQELAFYPRLSVDENLSFFAGAYGLSRRQYRERLAEVVEICKLSELIKRRGEHLSGGEKRRLNLAIALLNAPEILYLDEPTVGIDARSRRTILDAISALNRAGATIIYTSHYMEEVEAICDRIAIINHGRLLLDATMSDLITSSLQPKARLLISGPLQASQAAQIEALHVEILTPRELSASVSDADDLPTLLSQLSIMNIGVDRIEYGASKLEDIYLDVLRRSEAAL